MLLKNFSNFIPRNIIPNSFNEEDVRLVIGGIVNNKDFQSSDNKRETYASIEELKNPQDFEVRGSVISDELSKKEMNDPTVQAKNKSFGRKNYLSS